MIQATRREALKAFLFGCASVAVPWVRAQGAFPSKPLRIIVPTSPGGNLDAVARLTKLAHEANIKME